MTYIFLIMVIHSNASNLQLETMESMDQCRAAIKSISAAQDKASWSETLPRVGFIDCIEVKS